MSLTLIDNAAAFEHCCGELAASPVLALDTEFVRERTYYAKIGLIQAAVPAGIFCVDPLAIDDLSALMQIIAQDSSLKVIHSARQDLEIFFQRTGAVPKPVFDTQIAAAFVGFSEQIGYAALTEALCGVTLDKGHTRTDWLRRPLTEPQIEYAAADVRYLHEIHRKLVDRLEECNRLAWVEQDCKALCSHALYEIDPAEVWRRVKGASGLSGSTLAAVQRLAEWREETAQREDIPRAWVLRDDRLLEIAQRRPASSTQLAAVEGLSPAFRRRYARAVVECLREVDEVSVTGKAAGSPRLTPAGRRLARELLAMVRQRAVDAKISAGIVVTRREMERVVAGVADARLFDGWRYDFVGSEISARIAEVDEVLAVERS